MSNITEFPKTRTNHTASAPLAVLKLKAADCGGTAGKVLLLQLADHANERNKFACFPCIASLTESTGLSRRSVFNQLKKLETLGLITRQHQYRKGRQTVTKYHLSLDAINGRKPANGKNGITLAPRPEPKNDTENRGAPVTPQGCTSDTPRGAPRAPRTTNRTTNLTNRATPEPYSGPRCTDNEAERANFERLTGQPETMTEPQAAPINKSEQLATIRALISSVKHSESKPAPTSNP